MYTCQIQIPKANPLNPLQKHNLYLGAETETETEIHILPKHRGSQANVTFGFWVFGKDCDTHNAYAKTYVHTYIHTYIHT